MGSLFGKRPKLDREALLRAIPLPNELLRTTEGHDCLRLAAPLESSALRKVFAGKTPGAAEPEKTFELDELGAWVWRRLDGRRDVETLIHDFAGHFRINIREAEVSVLAFLKTLTERNLIALAAPREAPRRDVGGHSESR